MKAFSVGLGGIALGALLAASAWAGQAQHQPQPRPQMGARQLLPATQALFDGYVATNKMPGIVGAFGVGDLPTVFVSAGRIGDEPAAARADPDSLWRVYSMTKPITGMAAMILVQEGRLKLDQPLSDFFPGFKTMKVLTSPDTSLDSVPAKSQITIRELLTHSAGLGYSIVVKGPLLKEYERLGILPLAASAQTEVQMRAVRPKTLSEFAERVATLPLIAQPGTKWSYSIGLDVMGAVIEKASGMPFDRFVQSRIFNPLKMTSSYWSVPDGAAARLASNYAFVGDTRVPLDPAATSVFRAPPSFPYGGAGLVMSARDYDRFLHMLQDGGTLDGVQILKPETAALAMSNLLPNGVTFPGAVAATGGSTTPMGFGAGGSVAISDVPGGASKGTYGWGGAAGTIAWVDPIRHARGTVMVNYFPAEKWPTRTDVRVALLRTWRGCDDRPGLTGGTLDRADALRHDGDALAAAMGDWRARLLKLDSLVPEVDDRGALGWTTLADAPDDAELILLGLDGDRPHFAAWSPAARAGEPSPMRSPAITHALATLQPGEAQTYAAARSLIEWHTRHGHCANCGTPTGIFRAGWGRTCPNCGTEHFPRVDPVVIMIAEHDGRALLGRGKGWPEGRYSALAGFLEPGESIEEAVAREILEEAGVRVGGVRYVASQPWPFPSSLMMACIGEAEDDALTIDRNELEDAIWVPRGMVRGVLAGEPGPFLPPPPYAIAFTLLTEWAKG